MGILTDIYNTVAKFFRAQETVVGEDASKSVAQNRLKLVLMQDRTNLTPKVLEQMRGEMIELLSKYLEMDKDLLELNFEQEGDQVALMLSIPVIRAKDEDEIAAANESEEEEFVESFDDGDNREECSSDGESNGSECLEDEQEDAPKPRKRSKKVSIPEEMEQNECETESQEYDNCEQEPVCENIEG